MFLNKKRLFAFGCSFTNHNWNYTWPEILQEELQIPLYNYGKTGSGNQYIFNTIIQADTYYNFNENDLVIVCWSGVAREDRYAFGKWYGSGNIFYNNESNIYTKEWIDKYCDINGMALRDYASIKAIDVLLNVRSCENYFLSMNLLDFETDYSIVEPYKDVLNKVHTSFFTVLWNNDWEVKRKEINKLNPIVKDLHPSPIENLTYLTKTFNYSFSERVKDKVKLFQNEWEDAVRNSTSPYFVHKPYNLSQELKGFI